MCVYVSLLVGAGGEGSVLCWCPLDLRILFIGQGFIVSSHLNGSNKT